MLYHGILLSYQKEQIIDKHDNLDESPDIYKKNSNPKRLYTL